MRRLSQPAGTILLAILTIAAIIWSLSIARRSAAFALAINCALMALAYIVWLIVPLRFFDGYYRVHDFERNGLYDALAIRLFQRVFRRVGDQHGRVVPRSVHGPRDVGAIRAATIGPETAHCLIFFVVTVLALDAGLHRGWWDTAAWLVVFNVVLNGYPVLSLRQVRARVERLRRAH